MQNITEICKELGIEVEDAEALTKKVAENYVTRAEHKKRIDALELERDNAKTKAETAEKTIEELKTDDEATKKQIEEYKTKAEEAENKYNSKIQQIAYDDALNEALKGYTFSSAYAKKAVVAEIKAKELKLVDGKLMGIDTVINEIKETDPAIFKEADDEGNGKPTFTQGFNQNKGGKKLTKKDIMAITDRNERQKAIEENMELFN